MNPFGKFAIHVLTATLLFSAWVGAELPCESQGAESLHRASMSHRASASDNVAANDAHPCVTTSTNPSDQTDHTGAPSVGDRPCCDDDCAMVCATMGGSAMASVSVTSEPQYDVHARLTARTVSFRPQPPPQSLFRPPIS
jgi:hypothetical protein